MKASRTVAANCKRCNMDRKPVVTLGYSKTHTICQRCYRPVELPKP